MLLTTTELIAYTIIALAVLLFTHLTVYRRGYRNGVFTVTDRLAKKVLAAKQPKQPKQERGEKSKKVPTGIESLPPFVQQMLGPMLADMGVNHVEVTKTTTVVIGPKGVEISGPGFDPPDDEGISREPTPVEFNRENAAQAVSFAHDIQCPTAECPIRIFAQKRKIVSEEHRCEAVEHAKKHMQCCPPQLLPGLNNLIGVLEQYPLDREYVTHEDLVKAAFPPLDFGK